MELTQTHFEHIAHLFPKQRGNVSLSHLTVLNAILWPSKDARGRARMQVAWIAGVFRELAHHRHADESLGEGRCVGPSVCAVATSGPHSGAGGGDVARQHNSEGAPRWDGGTRTNGPQAIGKSRGGWSTKIHRIASDDRSAIGFSLSGGETGDAPQGRALLARTALPDEARCLVMDKADEGDETRQLVVDLGLKPVVPPKANRVWSMGR